MKLKVSKKSIWITIHSILVMFLCVNNLAFLNQYIPQGGLIYVRYLYIYGLIIFIYIKKKKIQKIFKWISLFMCILLIGSVIGGGELSVTLQTISVPYLICIFLEYFKKSKIEILSIWNFFMFILVIIDLYTMIKYPNGLYSDILYTENWFLGYKTNRFVYSLPLCILTAYLANEKKGKYGMNTYIVLVISATTAFYSQATGAFVSILLIAVLFIFLDISKIAKIEGQQKFINFIFDYKFLVSIYILILGIVFSVDKIKWLQYILVNILNKDATLTTRTYIWESCFLKFFENPIWGMGYISSTNFIKITENSFATSAHNMVLTILLSGGIIGIYIYIVIIVKSIKIWKVNGSYNEIPIIVGIISMLFIGISSSSLVFSFIGFLFYELLGLSCTIDKNLDAHINRSS